LILGGAPVLAVGLPLPGVSATYVEVFPLRELDRTLRYISSMLAIGVMVSGVAGAVLGRWASSRALLPLWRLTNAAGVAAGGDLSVRLPDDGDRDLAPLARAFNATAERLQRRAARDARFASDVSHELRSPITTMVNAMAVLKRRRAELTDTCAQALDLLDSELTRFQRMVADLLEISLADQGAAQLDLESVDLGELVRQTARGWMLTDDKLEIADPAPRVLADRRRLERAIANLLANAQDHGRGVARLAVGRGGGMARIEVDDAGPGVPVEYRNKIFERFARAPSSGAADSGTGLGLALVSEHVRRHGGQVWVTDRAPAGARFVIELREQEP
jgi:signal transduction histidine kinase